MHTFMNTIVSTHVYGISALPTSWPEFLEQVDYQLSIYRKLKDRIGRPDVLEKSGGRSNPLGLEEVMWLREFVKKSLLLVTEGLERHVEPAYWRRGKRPRRADVACQAGGQALLAWRLRGAAAQKARVDMSCCSSSASFLLLQILAASAAATALIPKP
jgi:hypothetical protein